MSPTSAEQVIGQLAERRSHVLELAELLAPAVRAEAALVRRLRIELLPHLSAAAEAELWFSPLVQAHSAGGLTLAVPVAVALRERLARQWPTSRRPLLKRARVIYAEVHAYLPEPLRLEEDVAWSLVAGDTDAVRERLASALAAVLAEPEQFRFWLAQAAARLPDGLAAAGDGALLARAAAPQEQLTGEIWAAAYRTVGTRPLAVRHDGRQLELGGPPGPGSRRIDVPDTATVPLELSWSSGEPVPSSSAAQAVRRAAVVVPPGAEASVGVEVTGPVAVRTAAGVSHVVRDDPFRRPVRIDPAADPGGRLQSLLAARNVQGVRLAEPDETAELRISLQDGLVTLTGPTGVALAGVPQVDPADSGGPEQTAALAAHVSRWLTAAELSFAPPDLAGAISVSVTSSETGPGRDIEVASTGLVRASVTNAGRHGGLFAAILALSSDWSVELVTGGSSVPLAPGDTMEAPVRLDIVGPREDAGLVRVVGVAARDSFDPRPLLLPPIRQDVWREPALVPAPPSAFLDAEIAAMAGRSAGRPAERYLGWTTAEALVRVRLPTTAVPASGWLRALTGHDGSVLSVAFSPDGARIATGGSDKSAQIWAAATGSAVARVDLNDMVTAIAFSPDGLALAAGSSDGSVRVFSAQTMVEGIRFEHGAPVLAVEFSPDGRWLASADVNGQLWLQDAATGDRRWDVSVRGPLSGMAMAPQGQLLATTGEAGLQVWNLATGSLRGAAQARDGLRRVAFSPDGQTVVTGGTRTLQLWRITETASRTAPPEELIMTREPLEAQAHSSLRAVAFSPDGRTVAGAGGDTVWLWDAVTSAVLAEFTAPGVLDCVAFSPDGLLVAAGAETGTVGLWAVPGRPEPESENTLGALAGRRLMIMLTAAGPLGPTPLAGPEDGATVLAGDLSARGLEVVLEPGRGAVSGAQVRNLMAVLRSRAAAGDLADLIVLYVGAHSATTTAGVPAIVLDDGSLVETAQFAAAFQAARQSLTVFDTDTDIDSGPLAINALEPAATAVSAADRSIALVECSRAESASDAGAIADALVVVLAGSSVVDSGLVAALDGRVAALPGGSPVQASFGGPPVSLPQLQAVPQGYVQLAERLAARGDLSGARDIQLRACTIAEGEPGRNDPETLFWKTGLAASHRALGDAPAARDLDQDTLARRRRVLGDDHPDTLRSMDNLAADLRALGQVQAAQELEEEAERLRRRRPGDGDGGDHGGSQA